MEDQSSPTTEFLDSIARDDLSLNLENTDNQRPAPINSFVEFLINTAVDNARNSADQEHSYINHEYVENRIIENEKKINYEFDINSLYYTYLERLKSFKYWPKYYHVNSKELATAGFFYMGIGDYVKCVCCDLVLHDLKHNINPVEEHIKKSNDESKNCEFVKLFLDYEIPDTEESDSSRSSDDETPKKKKRHHKKK